MPPMRCHLPPAVKSRIRKIVALTATPAARPKLAIEEAYTMGISKRSASVGTHGDKDLEQERAPDGRLRGSQGIRMH